MEKPFAASERGNENAAVTGFYNESLSRPEVESVDLNLGIQQLFKGTNGGQPHF